ncbi:hypothetical protein GV828_04210 [Flavobacterium sp. NST-5]|uniref:Porin n=1 Tax=Flavobacterium ichthyis TaxID=2698827 RepID=A0ABW9Z6E2_9FLAO|nr:putative porin [Flavobacterium ichthyis]NBL64405.1 hypothetical protein [Flavobacterium ichthyis]
MNFRLIIILLLICASSQTAAQIKTRREANLSVENNISLGDKSQLTTSISQDSIPSIDLYKIISINNDTTYVDTSLTIQKEYKFNYLRRDQFGLMPFANEGQTFTTLNYGLKNQSPYPSLGYAGKHFNYQEVQDINYYHVPTPFSELFFKTTMEQGQMLNALFTINLSEQLNLAIGYRGLRSLGKYVNQLSSNGNFQFSANYAAKNNRYRLKTHFTGQDLTNGENGGVFSLEDFESGDEDFRDRSRLDVNLNDARTILKGNRYFVDHIFRFNKTHGNNNLYFTHQLNYEHKFFEYRQPTVITQIVTPAEGTIIFSRFGDSYNSANINDKSRYNRMFNKVGAIYENSTLGQFMFFIEDFRYNYFYNRIIFGNDTTPISNLLSDNFNVVGGQYAYQKNNWNGRFQFSNSISNQAMTNLDLNLSYKLNEKNNFSASYQNISKVPDHTYNLFQSSYVAYNWSNNFANEKINKLSLNANTQWLNATIEVTNLTDHLYFRNTSTNPQTVTITPEQFSEGINYLSVKVSREFRYKKFALDNTILYQEIDQNQDILNLPKIVTRNTIYYTDNLFKKALFIQTGFTLNYFTDYFADDYNPVIGDFHIQNQQKIGNFPMLDFFLNAKVRNTRIYLKAEHFNALFGQNNYYSAPNYPYRDFTVRFGLVWNFFT